MAHKMILSKRGAHHRHRWQAACTCGWKAIPLRLKRSAKEAFDRHATPTVLKQMEPRPVTPAHALPEGWW